MRRTPAAAAARPKFRGRFAIERAEAAARGHRMHEVERDVDALQRCRERLRPQRVGGDEFDARASARASRTSRIARGGAHALAGRQQARHEVRADVAARAEDEVQRTRAGGHPRGSGREHGPHEQQHRARRPAGRCVISMLFVSAARRTSSPMPAAALKPPASTASAAERDPPRHGAHDRRARRPHANATHVQHAGRPGARRRVPAARPACACRWRRPPCGPAPR